MNKILLVDDDPDDRAMFCEALAEIDPHFQCHTAPNGRRAIVALDNGEIPVPDIFFLDLNMPLMNGWQCLAALKGRELYGTVPVIIYSTSAHEEDVRRAKREGAIGFLTKPSSFHDLKQCLELVVGHLQKGALEELVQRSRFFLPAG